MFEALEVEITQFPGVHSPYPCAIGSVTVAPDGIITKAKAVVVTTNDTTNPCNNVLKFFVIKFI